MADLYPGLPDSDPNEFVVFRDELFFTARNENGIYLYHSDGSKVSPVDETVLTPLGSYPRHLTVFNDQLFFDADYGNGIGRALYRFDGNTVQVAADVNSSTSDSSFYEFVVFENELYFSASDGVHGSELMRYNEGNPVLVGEIRTGVADSQPRDFALFDGALYFRAFKSATSTALYKYDGTSIQQAADVEIFSPPVSFQKNLYFAGFQSGYGLELLRYDGAAVSLAADIATGPNGSLPLKLFNNGSELLFQADDRRGLGRELFAFDGSNAHLVANISVGQISSNPVQFVNFAGKTFFWATSGLLDGTGGTELYMYDGVTVQQVGDVNSGQVFLSEALLSNFAIYRDSLYFGAWRTDVGMELGRINLIPEPNTTVLLWIMNITFLAKGACRVHFASGNAVGGAANRRVGSAAIC